jgi:hypothetical protein
MHHQHLPTEIHQHVFRAALHALQYLLYTTLHLNRHGPTQTGLPHGASQQALPCEMQVYASFGDFYLG